MRERILYIDAIKTVLIFLVIWGHTIQYTNANEGLGNPIAAFIYSFHMPMFMMLSGMFFKRQLQLKIQDVISKNFKRLLLPALTISLSLFTIIYINKPRGVTEAIDWLWACRPWFITTLFVCNIATCLVFRLVQHTGNTFLITFLFFCLIPSISDRLLFMYPFFILGFYLNEPKSEEMLTGGGKIALFFFAFCILYGVNTPDIMIYQTPYTIWEIHDGIHFDKTLYVALKRYIIGLCGSLGFFWLLKIFFCGIGRKFSERCVIQYIGKNTLGLYILQIGLFTVWMGIRNDYLSNLTSGKDRLAFILSFVVLLILLFAIYIIRKSKKATRLLLGE